ncbi:MAG: hypothetical protein KatS3mg003_1285 [Candidatus Nitrosocaldaceae archaeon]|nr:MAG: hypothetical protein KatS3mg003_0386 [Candidatus Nitrosocaldaceae archaeon]GIU71806.1 MAG: hypothetical protein KatS3mg003_1285 [Candidatus Nitrosocaldaceae archaeon]
MITTDITLALSLTTALLGTLGFSLAFKDYIASLIAGFVFRRVKHIKPGTRIKILINPVIKGDIIDIGWLRTTLEEVGDGDRLPSINTGRMIKIPNFVLFNNPVMIYDKYVIDEVIVNLKNPIENSHILLSNMQRAIEHFGYQVVDVNITQNNDKAIIHGIFKTDTKNMANIRKKILEKYLELNSVKQISINN